MNEVKLKVNKRGICDEFTIDGVPLGQDVSKLYLIIEGGKPVKLYLYKHIAEEIECSEVNVECEEVNIEKIEIKKDDNKSIITIAESKETDSEKAFSSLKINPDGTINCLVKKD